MILKVTMPLNYIYAIGQNSQNKMLDFVNI